METKLYYTKDELVAKPHFNFVDNGKDLYLHQVDGNFEIYKKLLLLKKDAPDVTKIYVELKTYLVVKDYLEHSQSRWMNEFGGYVFYSIKDYIECLDEANKNRLF